MNIRTRKRGRPCGLTAEVQTVLLRAIERGLPLKDSALLAGISYDTLNRWRNSGEVEDAAPEFYNFCNALKRAQAVAVDTLVSQIQSAARKDWKAAAWLLERRHPENWGRQQRLEHTGPNGAPIATVAFTSEDARNYISSDSLRELVKARIGGPEDE